MEQFASFQVNKRNVKDLIMWVRPEETKPGIDWDCPCLAGVKTGSCGPLFIDALDCHVKSVTGGLECNEKFLRMNECMRQNPVEYAEFVNILNGKE